MRNVLREKRGEGYIDIAVGILCLMLVIALAVSLFPVFMVKQQLNRFADEIVRQAEIVGSTSVNRRIEELREETGLDRRYPGIVTTLRGVKSSLMVILR